MSDGRASTIVLETINHEKINELLAPLAFGIEIFLAGNRLEIDFFH
jgi:hypothetical protein